jgi:hypothetical protein
MSRLHYHFPPTQIEPRTIVADFCLYGASPAAITAALEARRRGYRVALVVNSAWLGGLTAGGLSNTDIGNKQSIGGLARAFYRELGRRYGVEEEWRFEPHMAARVLHDWLREAGIEPLLREYVTAVEKSGPTLTALRCESGLRVEARIFVDASYEGDVLALAGVSHTVGREGNAVHGELLNGVQLRETHQFEAPVSPYIREGDPASGLLPGISSAPLAPAGSGDRLVQAYNFRMCLTQAADRLPFPRPEGYDPRDYELFARYLRTGWRDLFHKFDRIRGRKTDTNNHGAVSTDFIGGNHDFPTASWTRREEIFQAHVRWQQGLMWFLSHDPRCPAWVRQRMGEWGLPTDEFTDTGGWAHQLYIREARRMVSDYVVTELDCRGYRAASDAVGLGSYAMDSHNCQRVVVDGCVRNEGDVQVYGFNPYPIPYRSIVPKRGEATNLLVPVCVSASHIAYGSVRMEPVFMILGQSAAIAGHLALLEKCSVQDVPYAKLRPLLLEEGQALKWETPNPDSPIVYEPEAPPPADIPATPRARG